MPDWHCKICSVNGHLFTSKIDFIVTKNHLTSTATFNVMNLKKEEEENRKYDTF